MVIWLDLGFGTWKKQLVKFNRLKAKESNVKKYLEDNVKNKQAYFQVFKKKDTNYIGLDRYYVETYMLPNDVSIQLKDLNRNFNNPHRIDGLINLNDIMVSQGLADYYVFKK